MDLSEKSSRKDWGVCLYLWKIVRDESHWDSIVDANSVVSSNKSSGAKQRPIYFYVLLETPQAWGFTSLKVIFAGHLPLYV